MPLPDIKFTSWQVQVENALTAMGVEDSERELVKNRVKLLPQWLEIKLRSRSYQDRPISVVECGSGLVAAVAKTIRPDALVTVYGGWKNPELQVQLYQITLRGAFLASACLSAKTSAPITPWDILVMDNVLSDLPCNLSSLLSKLRTGMKQYGVLYIATELPCPALPRVYTKVADWKQLPDLAELTHIEFSETHWRYSEEEIMVAADIAKLAVSRKGYAVTNNPSPVLLLELSKQQ